MNHQDMINQVSDELRNTSIQEKITRWLNLAIVDLATTYVFTSLHNYSFTVTTPGIPDINLDADFLWIKTVQMPDQDRKLWPEDEQRLSESDPKYRTQIGTPTHYYFSKPTQISLYQVPGGTAESVTWSYQKRPIQLSTLTDTSDLPEEWHNLICQKAITAGLRYEKNDSDYGKSIQAEQILLRSLGTMIYRRTDVTAVLGGSTTRRKPARPKLPSNFPNRY